MKISVNHGLSSIYPVTPSLTRLVLTSLSLLAVLILTACPAPATPDPPPVTSDPPPAKTPDACFDALNVNCDQFAEAYLKASNTGWTDLFGHSVSLSGDTLAVGASQERSSATGVNGSQSDNSARNSGAVYIFTRSGRTWSQQAYLKASNTGADDIFGHSVSLSGDTLAVGAIFEDSSATGVNGSQSDNSEGASGAVYVFTRNGTTWSQQAYLKASNTGAGDWFGYSVSLSGDTLAVGAVGEDSSATDVNGDQKDNGATESGAVYVRRIIP